MKKIVKVFLILILLISSLYSQGQWSWEIGAFYLNNTVNDTIKSSFQNLGSVKFTITNEFHKYLGKSPFFVGAGIGIQFSNFTFTENTIFYRKEDKVYFSIDDSPNKDYKKSKLRVNYLQIPLIIGFSKGKFMLQLGVQGGLALSSFKKEIYWQRDSIISSSYLVVSKLEGNRETAVNFIQYGGLVRITYDKSIGIYTRYFLSPLFDKNKLSSSSYENINYIEFGISLILPRKKKSPWKKNNFYKNKEEENKKTNSL